MKQITGSIDNDSLSKIKRCYVDDLVATVICPKCSTELQCVIGGDDLNHPEVGNSISLIFYCETCEDNMFKKAKAGENIDNLCFEYKVDAKIINASISIEYDPKTIKEI